MASLITFVFIAILFEIITKTDKELVMLCLKFDIAWS